VTDAEGDPFSEPAAAPALIAPVVAGAACDGTAGWAACDGAAACAVFVFGAVAVFPVAAGRPTLERYRFVGTCAALVFAGRAVLVWAGRAALVWVGRAVLADLPPVLELVLAGVFAADFVLVLVADLAAGFGEDALAPEVALSTAPIPAVASAAFGGGVVVSDGVAAKTAAEKTMAPIVFIDRTFHARRLCGG